MTQEEKQLLIKDLSARLPYGVKVLSPWENDGPCVLSEIDVKSTRQIRVFEDWFNVEEVKPYLRPMSSMTENEQRTLDSMCNGVEMVSRLSGLKMFDKAFDWLNANHFDYRGLIEKGLALEAPEGMYENE